MTLRELLKDKTLPVKVRHTWSCRVFDVIFIGEQIAIGKNTFGSEYPIEVRDEYTIIEQPRPKKKMYAYLVTESFGHHYSIEYHTKPEIHPAVNVYKKQYTRAPNLDTEIEV